MEYVTLLGGYMVAVLVALLVAAHWLLKHDPALRVDPSTDSQGQPSSPAGD
ncbi:hypothetical protein LMG31506_03513 [Cupriavidus yeoncheonensis]|uniref:Uncharacterized protein n=1 Tax=Cupriavidus yeoncheonensis TaxID=1462994 RepID=A0A916MYL0_9BURK|nr:hypothetical protein [Cupriavidus yeoncheonensis]CAG2146953.1 hypothetical protein LMG31506_03513 [Cupriavidus yeoncheonensis]